MAYINIQNTKIYYATNRKAWKTDSGPQLVFIHGAGGDHRVWIYQIGYFRQRFNFYAVDLPGHGFSKGAGYSDIESYAKFIKDFITDLGLKESILIGHSMGGAVAIVSALKYPSHVKGTVLVGTGARLRVSPVLLEKFKEVNLETAQLFCKYAFSENSNAELIEKSKEMILQTPASVFYNDFIACNNFDIMNDIKYINVPSLIIGADQDQMTPLKYSIYLEQNIAKSKMITVKGSGHMIMMEKPEQMNAAMNEWLNEVIS